MVPVGIVTTSRSRHSSHGVPGDREAVALGQLDAVAAVGGERRNAVPTDAAVPAAIVRRSSAPEGRRVNEGSVDTAGGNPM
jgi:hypothetical protein